MESKLRADLLGFSLLTPASKSAEFVQWPCVIAVDLKRGFPWKCLDLICSEKQPAKKFHRCSAWVFYLLADRGEVATSEFAEVTSTERQCFEWRGISNLNHALCCNHIVFPTCLQLQNAKICKQQGCTPCIPVGDESNLNLQETMWQRKKTISLAVASGDWSPSHESRVPKTLSSTLSILCGYQTVTKQLLQENRTHRCVATANIMRFGSVTQCVGSAASCDQLWLMQRYAHSRAHRPEAVPPSIRIGGSASTRRGHIFLGFSDQRCPKHLPLSSSM